MISRNFNIALIEDNITAANPEENLTQLRRNLLNLPDGTDLVVLPELFTTGFPPTHEAAAAIAQRNSGDTVTTLHHLAEEFHVAFAGSFLAATASQLYNRAFFIEPNGDDTFYDKRHLFAPGGETDVFNPGKTLAPVIRYRGFNIKLIICYDLRFPVFCRNRGNEYDLLLVVANWPVARQAAWRTLLTARAIENQCYVCGVNRCGTAPDGLDYGTASTLAIDYKGKTIAQRISSPVIPVELSPAALIDFRDRFPVHRDADPFTLLP